jgi:hypothetical protein
MKTKSTAGKKVVKAWLPVRLSTGKFAPAYGSVRYFKREVLKDAVFKDGDIKIVPCTITYSLPRRLQDKKLK